MSGYEGTGRSLSLKLIDQLRSQAKASSANAENGDSNTKSTELGRVLHEVQKDKSFVGLPVI